MYWVELSGRLFRVISAAGIAGVLLAIVAHYLIFGPRHPELRKEKRDLKRFSLLERFIHAITLISFIVLGITGFVSAIWFGKTFGGWLRFVHIMAAPVFAVGMAAVSVRWAEDCRFEGCDWEWAKKFGGYLGDRGEVPAGRFNGGQKAFFWAILALGVLCMLSGALRVFAVLGADFQEVIYQVHRYSSLFLFMFAIVHIYLGTLANPSTWQIILTGYVSSRWAQEHHPMWWKLINKGTESPKEKSE